VSERLNSELSTFLSGHLEKPVDINTGIELHYFEEIFLIMNHSQLLLLQRTRILSPRRLLGDRVIRNASSSLSEERRKEALVSISKGGGGPWEPTTDGRDAICKTFEFADFSQAWAFMSRASLLAEKVRGYLDLTKHVSLTYIH